MHKRSCSSLIGAVLLSGVCLGAQAGIVSYGGRDAGAGPGDPRPVADAAQASFLSAVAGHAPHTLDFESIPVQYSSDINLTTMHLLTVGTTPDIHSGVTNDTSEVSPSILGYNTTPGGANFLRIVPIFDIGTVYAQLVFNSPVDYFGAFFTGLGTASGNLSLEFDNGTFQSLPVTGGSGGGVNYFGFTSFGQSFSSVTMALRNVVGSRDIFAIDDITTGLQATYVPTVPEPETYAMLLAGLGLLGLSVRRKLQK